MIKQLTTIVIVWICIINFFLLLGIQVMPLQLNFLGGGLSNYLYHPYPFAWINFDGEHYLALAQKGYEPLTYFFFPGYPSLISFINNIVAGNFYTLSFLGIFISYSALVFGLYGIQKIVDMDFKSISKSHLTVLILLFPTSYYFASYYTESLFLAISVWSFYFARKRNFLLSGFFGFFATLTRITGIALLPVLIIEWYLSKEKINISTLFGILLIPLGLLSYMAFLYINYGDPLLFTKSLGEVYGEQRAGSFVAFPQVFYRYIFKIIPNMDLSYWPSVYTILLEFLTAGIFLGATLVLYFKSRLSYFLYALIIFVLSTMSGSFSSLPRYMLVVFPVFIVYSIFLTKIKMYLTYGIYILLLVLLSIGVMLFTRGYWVS